MVSGAVRKVTMRTRRSSRLAPIALVAAALLLAPHPAIAAENAWDSPVLIGTAPASTDSVRVVADGSTLIAARLFGEAPNTEVVVSRSTDGVTWSPLSFLSEPGVISTDIELVSGGGRTTIAWLQEIGGEYRVQVAASSNLGSTWTSATTISPVGESATELHLATDGSTIVATWASEAAGDVRILVSTSTNGVSWSAAHELDSGDDAQNPYAAVEGDTIAVAWASSPGGVNISEVAASTTSGATWGAPLEIPGDAGPEPKLVLHQGQLAAVFATYDGPLTVRTTPDLGQNWPVVTGVSSGIDGKAFDVSVAADGDNLTVIWWVQGPPRARVQVASSLDFGVSFSVLEQLSTENAPFPTPRVTAAGDTRVAVWSETDGTFARAMVATSTNRGLDWSTPQAISASGGNAIAPHAVVRGTTATVVWGYTVGSNGFAQASSFTAPLTVRRIAGTDRYRTAVEISKEFAPGVPVVYLATGTDYPDALSAASAAASQGGPLLLTTPNALPAVVSAELQRLNPALVVMAGGTSVVSAAVQQQVEAALPAAVVRRDNGANRYETSRLIAERAFTTATTAFIATGLNFPDALSASAAAGGLDAPVILVNGKATTLDAATLELLTDLGVETVTVVGGTGVVSAGIETSLDTAFGAADVSRLSGSDRYATSLAINSSLFTDADTVYLATGRGFADALAGAALAGATPGPLFVVPGTCVPSGMLDRIDAFGASTVVLFGGTGVLTPAVASLTPC